MGAACGNILYDQIVLAIHEETTMFDNIFSTLGHVGTLTLFGGVFASLVGLFVVEMLHLLSGKAPVRRLVAKNA